MLGVATYGSITGADGKLFKLSIHTADRLDTGASESDYSSKSDLLSFDASASDPIYGASDTVQPPAYFTYTWLRTA